MSQTATVVLPLAIFAMALLYSSVGHAGASGYLAAMALLGVAPPVMKPAALTLNLMVAAIATVRFYQAGFFSWRTFWLFAATSIPFAFVGGAIALPTAAYKRIVGAALLFAAYRLFSYTLKTAVEVVKPVPVYLALFLGAGIGLLSGLTGVGGGIFLSPVLLLMSWADMRQTAGISAAFIFVNSAAGLSGNVASTRILPSAIAIWGLAAVAGGFLGSELGRRHLAPLTLRRLLALVLVIAGFKLLFG